MRSLMIFSGAGISADSGVATFRDKDGLWENHRIEDVATESTWKANFDKVHAFYNARRVELATVVPNAAHYMVRRMQERFNAQVITQNVDDLFERAGCTDVIHVHGKLTEMRCEACGGVWDIGYRPWDQTTEVCQGTRKASCLCRKGVRPNVVFFGGMAPEYMRLYAALKLAEDTKGTIAVIGTSGKVVDIGAMCAGQPGMTILSNLESTNEMSMPGAYCVEDRQFKTVLHGRASEMADQVEQAIVASMEA
ncbi:MAG: NAD-dependent deacetylase [Oxalobacteraceae bacterium]|nr:MAG: NAD-dependent deacetylase [Oxalobacteraceae bacterium]